MKIYGQNLSELHIWASNFSKFSWGHAPRPLEDSCFAFHKVCFTHHGATSTSVPSLAKSYICPRELGFLGRRLSPDGVKPTEDCVKSL